MNAGSIEQGKVDGEIRFRAPGREDFRVAALLQSPCLRTMAGAEVSCAWLNLHWSAFGRARLAFAMSVKTQLTSNGCKRSPSPVIAFDANRNSNMSEYTLVMGHCGGERGAQPDPRKEFVALM